MRLKSTFVLVFFLFFTAFFLLPSLVFANNPPQITNTGVNPTLVPPGTPILYTLTYQDADGDAPTYVRVITRDWTGEMKKISGDYKTGAFFKYQWVPKEGDQGSEFYFEVSDGKAKARFPIYEGGTLAPPTIIEVSKENKLYLFGKEKNVPLVDFDLGSDGVVNVDVSQDGEFWVAKTGSEILLFSGRNPQPLWRYPCTIEQGGNLEQMGWVAISRDGNYIAGGCQNSLYLFSKESNKPLWSYSDKQAGYTAVYNVAISKDGQYIALGTTAPDNGGYLVLFSKEGKILWQYKKTPGNIHALAISEDGNFIAAGTHCPDRKTYLFNRGNNQPLLEFVASEGSPVWSAAISTDGQYAVYGLDSADLYDAVLLFSPDQKTPVRKWTIEWWVRSLAMSDDGKYIAAGSGDHQIYLFDKDKEKPLWQFKTGERVGSVSISADGQYLVGGSKDKKVYLLKKESNEPLWSYEAPFWINAVAISADGNFAVAGTGIAHYLAEGHHPLYNPERGVSPFAPPRPDQPAEVLSVPATKELKLPGMIFGFGFVVSILGLASYLTIIKFNLLKRPPENLLKLNNRVVVLLLILAGLLFLATLVAIFFNPNSPFQPKRKPSLEIQKRQEPGKKGAVCGNGLCEPDLGESKETCPKDCSAGD